MTHGLTCAYLTNGQVAGEDSRRERSAHPASAFLIPLHHLRFQPSIPAGMNVLRICSIADGLRNAGREVDPPVLVRRLGPDDWLLVDGRHRWLASLVAGRRDVLAVEEVDR